jgi:rhamnosyl/mannosyltransferase
MRMKILCFGRFYDKIPGGMQRHVEHLFQALKDQVDYVHLVPSRDRHSAKFSLHGFPVVRTASLNFDGSVAISPGLIVAARQLHREQPFDLIHLHFPDPMSHLASMALPASIPRIISWHADITRQKKLLKIYRPLLNTAVNNAAAIIVATPNHISSSEQLRNISNPGKVHVIPYGFNLGRYLEAAPGADAIKDRFPGKVIFTLGRHVYYKGIDVLIQAMTLIDPDVTLLIGGTGPLTQEWQELVDRCGLNSRVRFLGMVDETELPAYYRACDLFCLPATSTAEAFGIVQVEAMASARPVVSTSLPSGVSFVNRHQDTGLIVPPGDKFALAEAINTLMRDDALRERLGRQARKHALHEFSLEAMASRTLTVYENCLRTKADE